MRARAKIRIASDHDIFDGQSSTCAASNSGKLKSIANEERSASKLLDSAERIFPTVTRDQRTERFLAGVESAEANYLANVLG